MLDFAGCYAGLCRALLAQLSKFVGCGIATESGFRTSRTVTMTYNISETEFNPPAGEERSRTMKP
jgi:hypothetical protein